MFGLGIIFLVLGGIGFEHREEVFRVGDFHASATTKRTMPALRYIGVALMGGGAVMVVLGYKQSGN